MGLQIQLTLTEDESNQLIQVIDAGVKALGINAATIAAITLQRIQHGAMLAAQPAPEPEPAPQEDPYTEQCPVGKEKAATAD